MATPRLVAWATLSVLTAAGCRGSSHILDPNLDAGEAGEPDGAESEDPSDLDEADAEADAEGDAGAGAEAAAEMDAEALRDAAEDAAEADDGAAEACVPFVMPDDCAPPDGGVLPRDLRCTGLYGDFTQRALACGVEPYTPAYVLWSDGAQKQRFVALPPGETIDVSDPEAFRFPVGTKLWKEFRVRVSGRSLRAETRLLQKSEQGWLYTTYVWSEDGETATQTNDGALHVHGSEHSVPTRDQCRECHAGRKDFALGWDMLLLGEGARGLTRAELHARGLLRWTLPNGESAEPDDAALTARVPGDDAERAALGYLHVNCGVSCHNPSADAKAQDTGFMMRLDLDQLHAPSDTPAVRTGANRVPGIHAKLPAGGPYFDLLPGDAEHSLLVARMRVRDATQMPLLGTNVVDEEGVALVSRFINGMRGEDGYPAPLDLDAGLPGPDPDASPELDAAAPADAALMPEDAQSADTGGPDAGNEEAGKPDDCSGASGPDMSQLGYDVVAYDPDLATLTFAAQPPDSDDFYLVEMRGRILRLHEGALSPFLDLTSAIQLGAGFDQTTFTYDERGLVGLAFAPDYASSGLFYVTITPSKANALGLPLNHDLVVEYQTSQGGAAPAMRRILVDVPSANTFLGNIHNANTVRFGPDGMLYVGMGDGGGVRCNDAELNAAQDVGKIFGKLLRLDPSRDAPYAAADNPFAGAAGGDPRVLHYGLRNPFRFSFDRLTGDLYLGDVGQDRYEELDFAASSARGLNFGWATYEANAACPSASRPLRPGSQPTPPIFVADRSGSSRFHDYRAIVGGVVYRGANLPALAGAYVFGDYYGTRLGALRHCGAGTSQVSTLRKSCDPNFPEACLATPAGSSAFSTLTAIVEDHAGELLFVANGNSLLKLVARP